MEALDLNLQPGNIVNENDNIVNRAHPLQAVWDEYRQLYYESIPEFVKELLEVERKNDDGQCGNGSNGTRMREGNIAILGKLKAAGFGDPTWSEEYRKVPGYKMNLVQLTRYMTREKIGLGRRQATLTKALNSIKNLKENMAKKILSLSESKTATPTTRTKKQKRNDRKRKGKRLRKSNKHENTATNQVEELSTDTNIPPLKSLFERAWASISSSIWGDSESRPCTSQPNRIIDTDVKENDVWTVRHGYDASLTDRIGEHANGNTGEYDEDDIIPSKSQKRDKNTIARFEKRIERKEVAAKQLQKEVTALIAKLREIKRTKRKVKPPIPMGEYDRAQIAVVEIRDSICDEFAKYIKERHNTSIQQYQTLDAKTDLTKPYEWYPYARLDRRKIVFHGGPTNSGKTYSALQRLKEAKKGLYLGPLRLLAAEVYETLTAEGLYTNLFTGQERREIAFSTHTAATVEMCNVNEEYDIVVIDEIQMIADASRGAAWTKALMGLRCKEIHVCGGLEAMDIVKKIADACGDDFESTHYERFSDLKVSKSSLSRNSKNKGAYKKVEAGDCIVAFSRNDIFAIKREIESMTNFKCSVIYGKLPPQTRADQARRFNDPNSGYDILVASDAIGMGLNLNIKRIVFNSIFKFNGEKIIRLSHSEIKQISGRAGRRNSPFPNGEVSCRDYRDLGYIRRCLSSEIEPLRKAALVPTEAHIELFADAIRAYTFSSNAEGKEIDDNGHGHGHGHSHSLDSHGYPDLHEILRQFGAMATVKGDFFLGRQNEMATIAKRLTKIPIRLRDAYILCLSPTTDKSLRLLESFATKVSQGEVFGLPSRPVPKKAKSFDDLSHLCNIYADADLFMWLQYKFPPGNAVELATALARKEQTMDYINAALSITEHLKLNHCYLKMSNEHRSSWESENQGPDTNTDIGIVDDFVEGYVDDVDGLGLAGDEYDERYKNDEDDDEYFIVEDKEAVY
jgi:ATP-dependent RNA helicase SUPV3L1/SUV3